MFSVISMTIIGVIYLGITIEQRSVEKKYEAMGFEKQA